MVRPGGEGRRTETKPPAVLITPSTAKGILPTSRPSWRKHPCSGWSVFRPALYLEQTTFPIRDALRREFIVAAPGLEGRCSHNGGCVGADGIPHFRQRDFPPRAKRSRISRPSHSSSMPSIWSEPRALSSARRRFSSSVSVRAALGRLATAFSSLHQVDQTAGAAADGARSRLLVLGRATLSGRVMATAIIHTMPRKRPTGMK
jgi:hypothetical protein